jgi:hypothetical protein
MDKEFENIEKDLLEEICIDCGKIAKNLTKFRGDFHCRKCLNKDHVKVGEFSDNYSMIFEMQEW